VGLGDAARASDKASSALQKFSDKLEEGTKALQGRTKAEGGGSGGGGGGAGSEPARGSAGSSELIADAKLLATGMAALAAIIANVLPVGEEIAEKLQIFPELVQKLASVAQIMGATESGVVQQFEAFARAGVQPPRELLQQAAQVQAAQELDVAQLRASARSASNQAIVAEVGRRGFDNLEDAIASGVF